VVGVVVARAVVTDTAVVGATVVGATVVVGEVANSAVLSDPHAAASRRIKGRNFFMGGLSLDPPP